MRKGEWGKQAVGRSQHGLRVFRPFCCRMPRFSFRMPRFSFRMLLSIQPSHLIALLLAIVVDQAVGHHLQVAGDDLVELVDR